MSMKRIVKDLKNYGVFNYKQTYKFFFNVRYEFNHNKFLLLVKKNFEKCDKYLKVSSKEIEEKK